MYLAIEIGGTKLQLVVADRQLTIIEQHKLPVDVEKGGEGIRQQIVEIISAVRERHSLQGVGVGFGGPVDWRTGRICRSHQIEGWSQFPLGEWIHELAQAPVRVDNDANVAALGEAMNGAGKGSNPVFYVTLGSGVGGGLVVDEKIYHGAPPGEAEIGHVRLDRSGTIVESRCSGWAVDARIRGMREAEPSSPLARLTAGVQRGEAKFLTAAIAQGDSAAVNILQQTSDDLAYALSHAVHLFHPEIIVLGGGLSGVGEALRAGVAAELPRYLVEAFQPGPRIALAQLFEDAVPVGALQLAAASAKRP
jgi:glucokinase